MCTIIVAVQRWRGIPLVVAANRDERLGRPAEPPRVREHAGRRIIAPLDLQAGGTWLGLTDGGLFVGITNRHDPAYFARIAPVSRGQVVLDALATDDARAAAAVAERRAPGQTNPYHLVVADRVSAWLVVDDGTKRTTTELPPGVHVVTQSSHAATPDVRQQRLQARLVDVLSGDEPPPWEVWRAELSRHDDVAPLEETCVHMEAAGYGTRSSTYVRLAEDPSEDALLHADGPPCVTPLSDLSARLATLRGPRA